MPICAVSRGATAGRDSASDMHWWAVVGIAIFQSFKDAAGIGNGAPTFHWIRWCGVHKSRLAPAAMPPNQLAYSIDSESSEHESHQKSSCSADVAGRAIQVVAEDISESGIGG